MQHRAQIAWSAIAGTAAGLALGSLLGPSAAPPPPPAPPNEAAHGAMAELETLRARLDAVRRERDALANQLAASGEPPPEPAEPGDETESVPEPAAGRESPDSPAFDEAWLRERGYAESEIARLRERWDAQELERLHLADRARREGWHGSARFRDRILELRAQLREEIGDDGYDVLLYAAGRTNQVVVSDVLVGSAAASVGIQDGDVIRSYAERRLFEVADLIRATGAGEAGRSTEVRVIRGEEELRFFVPRGPLGVRVRPERGAPDRLR